MESLFFRLLIVTADPIQDSGEGLIEDCTGIAFLDGLDINASKQKLNRGVPVHLMEMEYTMDIRKCHRSDQFSLVRPQDLGPPVEEVMFWRYDKKFTEEIVLRTRIF